MKKILLLCGFAISSIASEAQTKARTKRPKKQTISREAKSQIRLDSLQAQRQRQIDLSLAYQIQYDSVRKENERLADEKFLQEQTAWKENKYREMDSIHKVQWTTLSKDHEQWLTIQKQRAVINKAAKLNAYQDRQVNYINQSTFEKAKVINADSSMNEEGKKMQLTKLNDERRSKIKTIIGKSKERKLEKARKEKNNPDDKEAQWINLVDGFVKN